MSGKRELTLPPPLARIRESTREARETMAEKLFSRNAIGDAMQKAAGAGYSCARIEPDPPIDLKETPAAIAAAEWLKAEGFEVKWEKKTRPEIGLEWWVLVIEWRA